jgi:hypothetical protein
MNISFDEKEHRYYKEGTGYKIPVPGVSELIESAGLKSTFGHTKWHATRGKFAHKAIWLDNDNRLDMETVDPEVAGYLVAWRNYKCASGIKVIASEQIVYNESLGYAGTIDMIVASETVPFVLDLKTGSPAPWHKLQVLMYEEAARQSGLDVFKGACSVLYLKQNGTYKLIHLSDEDVSECYHEAVRIATEWWNKQEGVKDIPW